MDPVPHHRDVVEGWDRGVSGSVVRADRLTHVEHVWGTAVTIDLAGVRGREGVARSAVGACCALFDAVDRDFSTYKPLSEVSLHRNGVTGPGQQSADFVEVAAACRRVCDLTAGAFDPWAVPGGYDPSGYVKGWAAGRASQLLLAAGFVDHLVNAAGDLCAAGDERPGSCLGWPIGILNPHAPTEVIAVVDLRDQAMATSGRYERGNHLIDPRTGRAVSGVDSATVVGPDAGLVDALASAALVDGHHAMAWFTALGPDWSMYLVVGGTSHSHGPAFA